MRVTPKGGKNLHNLPVHRWGGVNQERKFVKICEVFHPIWKGNFGDEKKEVAYYEREIEEVMLYFKQTSRKVDTKMIHSFNNIADASFLKMK